MRENLEQYDLLIVEDIVDSGRTLSRLTQLLKNRNANSVKTCTLLDKPSRREVPFTPDYCGCQIEDEFVIGYGLDYNEKYRNLPYVGILKRSVYSN
jgi:hypoxanthine phosphoribosyltransferase